MYIPKQFNLKDELEIRKIIDEHSFATLISQHDGAPFATHLPLYLSDDHVYLYGHFARPNPQWKDINNQTVLAIFQGPHCYISPSWYETKDAVPTWNYVTVHITGEMELIDDEAELSASLNTLISKYESPSSSYSIEEVDSNYLSNLSKGVQGFKLKIKQIEATAKLSQNHSTERQIAVIEHLEKRGKTDDLEIAKLMRNNLNR
ncbi:transcriptional regulator [Lysinibacillus sp. 2017]|uniref:FMN-binding negative transcriptional regulator n=1 Tax=unclassified Lysinibacillus TaxID=2636778 RepID=UPI000D529042|nr:MULTISPECIES: FMN-binding negative transcriptional regulator [unclassified Lysinibacillus]AWE07666.1 transcriptional regulator [Lysinibacillus sp. 2017]TGN36828.1 FMN-binding negative transcriptional regulator [Lysinibacillus sp. S2017]